MKNSKGMEMAISTLILIVIGILVLVGIAYALLGGFKSFKEGTKPFVDTSTSSAIKNACGIACDNNDKLTFCCKEYDIDNGKIKCNDSRLEINCQLSCEDYNCNG
mgnify:CR=1 FL=1